MEDVWHRRPFDFAQGRPRLCFRMTSPNPLRIAEGECQTLTRATALHPQYGGSWRGVLRQQLQTPNSRSNHAASASG
jgi:hypothetical protein